MTRRQDAWNEAISAQQRREAAECEFGAIEGYLYQARKAQAAAAVDDARRKLRAARHKLHRAVDADMLASERYLAIEKELDRKTASRHAAKAQRETSPSAGAKEPRTVA